MRAKTEIKRCILDFFLNIIKITFFFCRNPRGCRMCWDSHQWQINPEGRSDCSHKHKLVASSYCGLCHIKLCTSIFNRGAIWQPANGRHKRTAAHFSDAKKMHTQAKFRPCGSFFRICAFPPSVIIMRVCATILIAYSSLPKPRFLHPRWDAPKQTKVSNGNRRRHASYTLSNVAFRRREVWKW